MLVAAALAVGACGARAYARLAAPYYALAARAIALAHPWQIERVRITSQSAPGAVLQLEGAVRRRADDAQPAARLVSQLQLAALVQSPVIFWSVLLAWSAPTRRRRVTLLLTGLPVFLGLEAATTVCQLLTPFAYASAVLAGESPTTLWLRWSNFLEEGGRVGLALAAALCAVALAAAIGSRAAHRAHRAQRQPAPTSGWPSTLAPRSAGRERWHPH